MNSETILKTDVLDIVFEKRNKMYGAYPLRKFYKNRLFGALTITIGAATVLSAFTFIPENSTDLIPVSEVTIYHIAKTKVSEPKKLLLKQSTKSNLRTQKIFTIPLIVDNDIKPDSIRQVKPTDVIGIENIDFPDNDLPANSGLETVNSVGIINGKAVSSLKPILNEPTENPEIQPSYPGGVGALKKFLERNLVNPTDMEPGEMVAVNVKFVVGYDGKLQNFTVTKNGGDIFNKEVIRVLKKMPQWVPGKSNGQNVPVYFVIPIKFVPAD